MGEITEDRAAARHHFSSVVPELADGELVSFVEGFIARRESLLAPLDRHASPLYLFDRAALVGRATEFKRTFDAAWPDMGYYFAVKANNYPGVARELVGSGYGLDVSSGLELGMALDAGASKIAFSGPAKSVDELRLAVSHHAAVTVLLDSSEELSRLESVAMEAGSRVDAGVRLTTNPTGLWRKFGIPLGDLHGFWEDARKCPHVRLVGLQFHNSWNMGPQNQVSFIEMLGRELGECPGDMCEAMQFVDVGGGFWPPRGEWLHFSATPEGRIREARGEDVHAPGLHFRNPASSLGEFARALTGAFRDHLGRLGAPRICVEPGRWICNDAMHLVITVVDRKGHDIVITDAGTNAIGWERFESDYFPLINLTRPSTVERSCYVLGSLCTPHDVWGYSYFGEDIRIGDVLLVPTQGAYTYSLRQRFIKPLPEVVPIG
jgi:diaminopimelate decarboxylase